MHYWKSCYSTLLAAELCCLPTCCGNNLTTALANILFFFLFAVCHLKSQIVLYYQTAVFYFLVLTLLMITLTQHMSLTQSTTCFLFISHGRLPCFTCRSSPEFKHGMQNSYTRKAPHKRGYIELSLGSDLHCNTGQVWTERNDTIRILCGPQFELLQHREV